LSVSAVVKGVAFLFDHKVIRAGLGWYWLCSEH